MIRKACFSISTFLPRRSFVSFYVNRSGGIANCSLMRRQPRRPARRCQAVSRATIAQAVYEGFDLPQTARPTPPHDCPSLPAPAVVILHLPHLQPGRTNVRHHAADLPVPLGEVRQRPEHSGGPVDVLHAPAPETRPIGLLRVGQVLDGAVAGAVRAKRRSDPRDHSSLASLRRSSSRGPELPESCLDHDDRGPIVPDIGRAP